MCLSEIELRGQKFDNHSMLNSQHSRGGAIPPLHEHKNLRFHNKYGILVSSKNYEGTGYSPKLDLLNHHPVFYILGEVAW